MSTRQIVPDKELEDYESFSPIMSREEANDWFTKRLGRIPEAADIFKIGKSFYSLGAYSRALVCFQHYITFSNALTAGHHALGYCYLQLGEIESAFHEFKYCATSDIQEDWQLVVEIAIEIESMK
ncbi:hypothetical protein HMI54_004504 [Coelomomyces lativittatus]|nr:hypothetical protein HMI54_004504 [Coelomomyces lativittatus]